jgi:cysteinyl-tRNA synthetase
MYIYDTSKKEKLELIPIHKKDIKIYICGPTVYDDAHLGHARSSIAFDMLNRILRHNHFQVTLVKNITDVDDKIIKKAKEQNKSIKYISDKYLKAYQKDMRALNIIESDIEPLATQNIPQMISMIEVLLEKDIAYTLSNKDIYFDTSKDDLYCSISHRCEDEENSLSRIEQVDGKRNASDYALWKADEIDGFDTNSDKITKGRPGWHIECSAMIDEYLSYDKSYPYSIDIHAGGADLLFPHHENEASQSRCANNQELAKY